MKQKTLQGGETVVDRAPRIREVFGELGDAATLRAVTVAAIDAGIFDEDFAEQALYRAAETACRRALKLKDGSGLPFAGPVREIEGAPAWVQRQLWQVADYRSYVARISTQRNQLDEEVKLAKAECRKRFGKF